VLVGPLRQPVNPAQQGSIHDDAVARKLGFRGGTIAGSIHMEQFPPLLLRAFGPRWYESGNLSLYFLNATLDREPVRALVDLPPQGVTDAQVRLRMEREDGMRVAEGSASVGTPDEPSALRRRLRELRAPGELRLLAGLEPGVTMGPRAARIEPEQLRERLETITEPLPEYAEQDVVTPTLLVQLLRACEAELEGLRDTRGSTGLFGAIETGWHGPVHAGRDYLASGKVLAVGDSPKTEYFWYESRLTATDDERPLASMIMLLRFMKASSPLWA